MHIIWLRGLYTTVPFRMKWSVVQSRSCLTLCDPMDCSTPGFPVLHNPRSLPKLMSIELVTPSNHLILCHPLLLLPLIFPSIRVFSSELVLAWGGQNIEASVPPMNIQGWFPLELIGLISLQSKGLSGVFCSNIVQKHQFFGAQSSLWSNSHVHTWPLKKCLTVWTFVSKIMSLLSF